jgi:hypothetical protein
LPVDSRRLVELGEDHVQAARFGDAVAEPDVRAAARHVGGDRHPPGLPRRGDDLRLALILFRAEDDVVDPVARQRLAERLRHGDRACADQHRTAALERLAPARSDHRGETLFVAGEALLPRPRRRNGRFVGTRTTRNP